jgi:hypothetical protein
MCSSPVRLGGGMMMVNGVRLEEPGFPPLVEGLKKPRIGLPPLVEPAASAAAKASG